MPFSNCVDSSVDYVDSSVEYVNSSIDYIDTSINSIDKFNDYANSSINLTNTLDIPTSYLCILKPSFL
jgi:hypothetical protein